MTGDSTSEKIPLIVVSASLGVILTISILVIVYLVNRTPSTAPIEILPPAPAPTHEPTPTPGPLVVYVTGAVKKPGVVTVDPNARVQNAIDAAGGLAAVADLQAINLAGPVSDGQHIHVLAEGEPAPIETTLDGGSTGPVNINTATGEELMTLPGIGSVTAAAIIEYREKNGPFARIEDIQNVPGIAEGKFNGCKELITVGP